MAGQGGESDGRRSEPGMAAQSMNRNEVFALSAILLLDNLLEGRPSLQ
jgi:hypothetical protein